jgi:hypothetical protein
MTSTTRRLFPLFLAVALLHAAGWVASDGYGIRIPVPDGWTSHLTDTSISITSNQEAGGGTVVVGVQFFPNFDPWGSAQEWREGTLDIFVQYLTACPGRLLTPSAKGLFKGDTTDDATYLTIDPSTYTIYAGRSRFLAHGGKGYELFVMGDTTPLYDHFPKYDSLLERIEFVAAGIRSKSDRNWLDVRRLSPTRFRIEGAGLAPDADAFSLDGGRAIPFHCRRDGATAWLLDLAEPPARPFVLEVAGRRRLVVP